MDEQLDRFITYLIAEKNASPYTIKNYHHEIEQFLAFLKEERDASIRIREIIPNTIPTR